MKSTLCRQGVGQMWGKTDGSVLIRWEYLYSERNAELDVFIYIYKTREAQGIQSCSVFHQREYRVFLICESLSPKSEVWVTPYRHDISTLKSRLLLLLALLHDSNILERQSKVHPHIRKPTPNRSQPLIHHRPRKEVYNTYRSLPKKGSSFPSEFLTQNQGAP